MAAETTEKIDAALIQSVLTPYASKNTVYLQSASVLLQDPNAGDHALNQNEGYIIKGHFSIDQSCYIDDTGHFNAVEFNICYNQLFYVAIAYAYAHQHLNCLKAFSLDDFYRKQLSDIYITSLESHYKRVINPSQFIGILSIKRTKVMQKIILFKTEIKFTDANTGLAYGKVDVVIV